MLLNRMRVLLGKSARGKSSQNSSPPPLIRLARISSVPRCAKKENFSSGSGFPDLVSNPLGLGWKYGGGGGSGDGGFLYRNFRSVAAKLSYLV